jgi:CRP-like cAMP-binding protein
MRHSNRREDLSTEEITLNLPIDTPLADVVDRWISLLIARVGTQQKASVYLDVAPKTVSRRLNRRRRGT